MAQANTLPSTSTFGHDPHFCASLNEMLTSIAKGAETATLRQIADRGFCDFETVSAAISEQTRKGELAAFKVGPLHYYASPLNALTMKGPAFKSLAVEMVKNALWHGKRRIKAITEKV